MKINTRFNQEQASKDISLILNPEEAQEDKNKRIRKEMSQFLGSLK